jgi:hypothetical protein
MVADTALILHDEVSQNWNFSLKGFSVCADSPSTTFLALSLSLSLSLLYM